MDYAEFFEEVTDYREAGRCLPELSDILGVAQELEQEFPVRKAE